MFWAATIKMVRAKFPEVMQLSTETLASWLEGSGDGKNPLILDVREPIEYNVSHLGGALNITSKEELLKTVESLEQNRPIVLYCSVGYRSSKMALFLINEGYPNVYNLEGSIFAWANEGRKIYHGKRETDKVHPYDKIWGRLLKNSLRVT